jgi:hypothetical protein
VPTNTAGSGALSPDPAVHDTHDFENWCDDNDVDPFEDDGARERYEVERDLAIAEARIDAREWQEMMG